MQDQDANKKAESTLSDQSLPHKPSAANKIWAAIVMAVLAGLYLETKNNSQQNYNLFLSGDSQALGAKVFVDGKAAGVMSRCGGGGLGGAIFYGHAGNGAHNIEVRKQGFTPVVKKISMHGEDYLDVDLQRDADWQRRLP